MKLPAIPVRFEQAVYGSFPFWNRGYAFLTHSAGCRPEWLAELPRVCQKLGEPPASAPPARGLFALRLRSGPWMVVGVYPQGCDDHGRPGATAFHALFFSRWAYRWAGADPFALASLLRGQWSRSDETRPLPAGRATLGHSPWPFANESHTVTCRDPRLSPIVAALARGQRVVLRSEEPIDELAQAVWRALPNHARARLSVATWAFDNANGFDLVALPKLTGVKLSSDDLVFA